MKSFVIAICILISITVYIFISSAYFLRTEAHILSELDALDSSDGVPSSDRSENLCSYFKERSRILSLYIHRSKCAELEFLLKEMDIYLKTGNPFMLRLTKEKIRESLRDIRENDTFPTLSGIT